MAGRRGFGRSYDYCVVSGASKEADLASPATHVGVRRTLNDLQETKPRSSAPGSASYGSRHCRHRGHGHQAQNRPRRPSRVRDPAQKPWGAGHRPIRVMRDALLRRNEVEALMREDGSMGPDGSGRPTVAMPTKRIRKPPSGTRPISRVLPWLRLRACGSRIILPTCRSSASRRARYPSANALPGAGNHRACPLPMRVE